MEVERIVTEDPKREQWRLLAAYSYEANIRRYMSDKGLSGPTPPDIEYISGSIRQAQAYFLSAEHTTLDIAPLLAYYGAVNLLSGVAALSAGSRLAIVGHGMKSVHDPNPPASIGDVMIGPVGGDTGALRALSPVYSPESPIPGGFTWTVKEILASIPDLKLDFLQCYPGAPAYVVGVRELKHEGLELDRIDLSEFVGHANPVSALQTVARFAKTYLTPQLLGPYVVLRRRIGAAPIGVFSISGQKHLLLGHNKGKHVSSPSQPILLLMGLFALGHLTRYYPERWNPFVQADKTGERAVIAKVVDVAIRYLPNLALESLLGHRVQFVYETGLNPALLAIADEERRREIREEVERCLRERGGAS